MGRKGGRVDGVWGVCVECVFFFFSFLTAPRFWCVVCVCVREREREKGALYARVCGMLGFFYTTPRACARGVVVFCEVMGWNDAPFSPSRCFTQNTHTHTHTTARAHT